MCLGGFLLQQHKREFVSHLKAEKAVVVAGVQNSSLQFVPPACGGERMGWMTS